MGQEKMVKKELEKEMEGQEWAERIEEVAPSPRPAMETLPPATEE